MRLGIVVEGTPKELLDLCRGIDFAAMLAEAPVWGKHPDQARQAAIRLRALSRQIWATLDNDTEFADGIFSALG